MPPTHDPLSLACRSLDSHRSMAVPAGSNAGCHNGPPSYNSTQKVSARPFA
jgi:hypothetical protein